MYKQFKCLLAVIIVFTVAGYAHAQNTTKLEYKFTPGTVLRYKILEKRTGDIIDWSSGAITVIDGILKLQVTKALPNGDAEIKVSYEKGTIKSIGEVVDISSKHVPPVTLIVSKNGAIKNIDSIFADDAGSVEITHTETSTDPDSSGSYEETKSENLFLSALAAIIREYPDKTLKTGEKWYIQPTGFTWLPFPPKYESKLVSLTGATSTAVIVTSFNGKVTPPVIDDLVGETIKVADNTKVSFSTKKGCITSADIKHVWSYLSDPSQKLVMNTTVSLISDTKKK